MRRFLGLWLASAILVLGATPAAARVYGNAFTMSEGDLFGRLGVSYFVTSNYRNDDGEVKRGEGDLFYRDVGGHFWLRWSVLDAVDLGLYGNLRNQYRDSDFNEDSSFEMGDLEFDTRVRLVGGTRAALAVSALVKLPWFYDADADLPPGDGQIDAEGRLWGAVKFSLFTAGMDGGYRYRAGEPADVYVYGGELGFGWKIVYGKARVEGEASVGNAEDDAETRDFLKGPDYAMLRTNIMFGVRINNHWSLDVTGIYTAYGRNVAHGMTYMLATNILY